ncbi:small multi-drug export protein [Pseudalkalibacillus sp. Hm43]|uniref:small multi-drug export protein n=1 Tax=Pseudalkalibacillus sp. Hm43 TaxID=3450742 RepID=UPI003F42BF29
MEFMIAYLIVFLLAATPFFEMIAVIPIGIIAGLNPWVVILVSLLGNLLTVLLVILLIEKITIWLEKRREKKGKVAKKRSERAERIWKKYGLPGLALFGPILVGSHLAAFLSMAFVQNKRMVAFWMQGSLILWAVVTGVLTYYGVDFFYQDRGDGFLVDLINK